MRRHAIVGLGLFCLLGACAQQGGPAAPGMAWSLNHAEGEGAKLAFGQPESDNLLLMMTCQARSGEVMVTVAAPDNAPARAIELKSNSNSTRLPGQVVPAMAEGEALIEAQTKASDPTLANFARTGDLSVGGNGASARLPVTASDRKVVRTFLATCRAA